MYKSLVDGQVQSQENRRVRLFRIDEYEGPKSLFRHYLIGPDAAQDGEQRHLLSRPSSAVVLEERTRNLGHSEGKIKGTILTQYHW